MANLVTVAQTDSTNDGSGASTLMEPPQVDNATDDAILIKVTQSLNNASNVQAINVTAPTGYTLLVDLRDAEIRSWVYYKRSTGSETIPTVTSDTSARWTCTTAVVTDVDWANGGVAQQVSNTSNGNLQSPDLTTQSGGNASAIVCFYSVERRLVSGFIYPETRPQTVFSGAVSTGTAEGIDNSAGAGFDFITDRSTVFEAPFWRASASGDSLAINVEIVVQGNIIPLQVATYVTQPAPSNSLQTTMNWCREIVNSGRDLDGNILTTYTFDASSDVDAANDTITITGHGMDESMVVHFSDGGNTAPAGLSNDTFYYVFPQDANTIKLCTVNEDTDADSDYYYNGTTQRPIVNITGTSTGTMTFTEARMINAGQGVLDVFRPPDGSASNVGPAPGNYIGDAGYNQNFLCTAQRFNSVDFDATDATITFRLQINSSARIDRIFMTLIDGDGDWINWKFYQKGVSLNFEIDQSYQFQVDKASVQAVANYQSGTFDHTRIRYFVIATIGANTDVRRWGSVTSIGAGSIDLGGPLTVIGGENANFDELVELASTYTDSITKPSDLQIISTIPITFGDGTSDVSFSDSEKSLAFPPLADGINALKNYLASLGVEINATSSSNVKIVNSQIGASVPYSFNVTAATGSTVDLTGNSYVLGTVILDADASYNRQVYVGGNGITDNGAEIRNSTFIINSNIGADNGMVNLTGTTDIESSTFELQSGVTTGHAIEIGSAGTYTFTDLTFSSFGADGTNTAAIYNSSGGAVTVNVFGGSVPTVRNSAGSTTTVNNLTTLTLTGLQPNSEVRVFTAGTITEVAGVENSGTSFTANISAASVDIVVHSLGYEYQKIEGVDTSSNLTLPIQQRFDRNYRNP